MSAQYEVLNPWAEIDPVPLRGIMPRVADLSGKKIGLFLNNKEIGREVLLVVEEKLRERIPDSEISWYVPKKWYRYDVLQLETKENREIFEEWLREVDTVVAAIGD